MVKKIFGILFFVVALLALVSVIAGGSLFSDRGSVAATYGNFVGNMLPIVLYVVSGITLLTFESPAKLSYVDGFKKRGKQSPVIMTLLIIYAISYFIVCLGMVLSYSRYSYISSIVAVSAYFIPFMIFLFIFSEEVLPNKASRKYFIKNDADLNEYLSSNETFQSCTSDNTVLASSKALYFPKVFCVVPFDKIASINPKKELWVNYVYFNLSNGKKFYINTKHFDKIQEAINANKQSQQ